MTNWRELEAMTDRIVIGSYSETIRHVPIDASTAQADTTRPAREIKGVVHSPNAAGTVSFGKGMATSFASQETAVVFLREQYPDLVIRARDNIRLLDRPGTPWKQVSRVSDRYASILVAHLAG